MAALVLIASGEAWSDSFVGQASVIDGDTLEIHGTRIRLWGIDAPESSQLCRGDDSLQYRCGAQAANELDTFIDRRPVNCIPTSLDRYGRTVATCSVDGTDLGEWLVKKGLALDWPAIQTASMVRSSVKLNRQVGTYGKDRTSSPGCTGSAFAPVADPPIARTMRMLIPRRPKSAIPIASRRTKRPSSRCFRYVSNLAPMPGASSDYRAGHP